MAGYNRVIMVGNLTRDPEFKQLPSGQAVCRLGLASNRQFKNRQSGDMIQEVCYIDIDVWGAQAESCNQYLQKGRAILVEGRIKFDTWEDPNGQTRSKHAIVADRVVFLTSSAESAQTVDTDAQKSQPSKENKLEKDLMDQINQIKKRSKPDVSAVKPKEKAQQSTDEPKKSEKETSTTGEIAFKDEPPFQDDLPF